MPSDDTSRDILESLQQVGLICTQWAYLEWLLEITNWWLLGLLNKQSEGSIITGSLAADVLAIRMQKLSHLKISDETDRGKLENVRSRIGAIVHERNLAVHGVRSLQPDNTVLARVARGPLKNAPQILSLVRLRSLNAEIASLIAILEPLLVRYGVIAGMTDLSAQILSSQLGTKG